MPCSAIAVLPHLRSGLRVVAASIWLAAVAPSWPAGAGDVDSARLQELVAGSQRSQPNRVRDPYRHPFELLSFFGVGATSTVVEILPGGAGYWTEILAPYLRDHGRYVAAIGDKEAGSAEVTRDNAAFAAKIAADPQNYGKVEVAEFAPLRHDIAAAASADFVLTFRNIHNWMAADEADQAFRTFYRVLKPGGILGVEEHRGRTDQPQDPKARSGYVRQDYAIALAQAAGFRLVDSSEVNANPKIPRIIPSACGRCRRPSG